GRGGEPPRGPPRPGWEVRPRGGRPPRGPPRAGGAPPPPGPPRPAGPGAEPLLKELARDGRASTAALAAAIHWHESTVRRRIDELRQSGLLVFEVDIDNRVLGLDTHAVLWLSIEHARLEDAATTTAPTPPL